MELLNLYGYLSVLLRGLILASQSLLIGGVFFTLFVFDPGPAWQVDRGGTAVAKSIRSLIDGSAIGLIAAQTLALALNAITLNVTAGIDLLQLGGATFVTAGVLAIVGAVGILTPGFRVSERSAWTLAVCSCAILGGSLLSSHALARVDGRALPAVATVLHQTATAAWIGGLPYLLITLSRSPDQELVRRVLRRFSRLAFVSVIILFGGGLMLTWSYIGSVPALVGTTYGVMTLLKAVFLAGLVVLGAKNRALVRHFRKHSGDLIRKLRSFSEAEIGIGFTVVLAAASLTSQPPAIDFAAQRVNGQDILGRLAPRWPRLSSPTHDEISPSTRQMPEAEVPLQTPNTPADIAWSEYNHHWAGLIVLGVGVLAMLYRSGFAPGARHWPLLFLALGAFILLRADPEGWPLGPDGFFEGLSNAEVLQHRLAVILVAAFGIFEWRVRIGLVKSQWPALIFPAVCAAGGVVLLTHAHDLGNPREELLAEVSHLTLAALAVAAGWTRWLELRLPLGNRGVVSWIWPICFALIGVLLLDYREA